MNPAEPPGGPVPDVAFAHGAAGTELNAVNDTADRRFCWTADGSMNLKRRAFELLSGISASPETDDQPGAEMAVEPGGIFQQRVITHA